MVIFTPTNQKRLTNVSVVRLKRGGKRFEVACYPNKVNSWRLKLETNLREVVQTEKVFVNVSKGEFAKTDDLQACFDTTDEAEICKLILEKGELQVTTKEREVQSQYSWRAICSHISRNSINPNTEQGLPYPPHIIEKALKDCHFVLKPNCSVKQQTLAAFKTLLNSNFPIRRISMRLQVTLFQEGFSLLGRVKELAKVIESEVEQIVDEQLVYSMVLITEPDNLHQLQTFISFCGLGTITVIDAQVYDLAISDVNDSQSQKPHPQMQTTTSSSSS